MKGKATLSPHRSTCYVLAPIPLQQRIRFGVFALEARWRTEWTQLDEIVAKPWLIDRLGKRAYEVIWETPPRA